MEQRSTVEESGDLERMMLRSMALAIGIQGGVLFVAAGTLHYWQAWTHLALHAVSLTLINVYLLRKDPQLLRRRLAFTREKERDRTQRLLFALVRPLLLVLLLIAGLDRRFGWSSAPAALSLAGAALFALGSYLSFLVVRENRFASSLIEVVDGQQVVTTGPYRVVRHPMYAGFVLMAAAGPLLLGSYPAALPAALACALLMMRLLAEERLLVRELPGYAHYMGATRRRLVPGVW